MEHLVNLPIDSSLITDTDEEVHTLQAILPPRHNPGR